MATSNYGEVLVQDRGDRIDIQGKRYRFSKGATPVFRSPHYTEHFVDKGVTAFASWLPLTWTATETGAGGSKALFVPVAQSTGGVYAVGVSGATNANAEELALTNVGWAPATQAVAATAGTQVLAQSRLIMEARCKFVGNTTATKGDFFVGFSNVTTATSGRAFSVSTASAVTTGLTEGAMIGYSSVPTSGTLFNATDSGFLGIYTAKATVAGAATLAIKESTAVGFAKDSLFHIYRVEIDGAGNCAFYFDDIFVGSAAAAVTAATALTPYVGVVSQGSVFQTGTIDYISVGGSEI